MWLCPGPFFSFSFSRDCVLTIHWSFFVNSVEPCNQKEDFGSDISVSRTTQQLSSTCTTGEMSSNEAANLSDLFAFFKKLLRAVILLWDLHWSLNYGLWHEHRFGHHTRIVLNLPASILLFCVECWQAWTYFSTKPLNCYVSMCPGEHSDISTFLLLKHSWWEFSCTTLRTSVNILLALLSALLSVYHKTRVFWGPFGCAAAYGDELFLYTEFASRTETKCSFK